MVHTIGVDVGGTKVAAGLVDEDGRILARARRDTPAEDAELTEDVIVDVVHELRRHADRAGRAGHADHADHADHAGHAVDVAAVGVGAAGLVDVERSRILFAPNLAWRDEPLRDELQRRLGLPVVVENDANAAAWAESRFGAARDRRFVVLITVGTGIGGGIVLDDRLYRGRLGIAAELGHMTVERGGRRCGCGNRGCWERYASGRALLREAQEIAALTPGAAQVLLGLAGGEPEDVTGQDVTRAAQQGDPAALEAFAVLGAWLGHGMAMLAAVLDPEVFVLGGGVASAGELLRAPAEARFLELLTAREHRAAPEVRLAELGGDAGIVGAADLARTT